MVNDGTVEARKVVSGLAADGFMEIREGLKSGEAVVARASSFLRHGDRVRPVQPKAEAAASVTSR